MCSLILNISKELEFYLLRSRLDRICSSPTLLYLLLIHVVFQRQCALRKQLSDIVYGAPFWNSVVVCNCIVVRDHASS